MNKKKSQISLSQDLIKSKNRKKNLKKIDNFNFILSGHVDL